MSLLLNRKVTFKRVRPNPLFEDWVGNMYEEAKTKKSKLEPMLKEALESLSKYPVPLQTGAECVILKGFGKELCKYLDLCLERYHSNKALSQYCDSRCDDDRNTYSDSPTSSVPVNEDIPWSNATSPTSDTHLNYEANADFQRGTKNSPTVEPQTSSKIQVVVSSDIQVVVSSDSDNCHNVEESPTNTNKGKKTAQTKKYKPALRSGGYAILMALLEQLYENPDTPSLTKEQLIEKAQKHSEESFVRCKPDSFYTAWSNMSRLISKGLVQKMKKRKPEYLLTEEGKDLARLISIDAISKPTVNDIIFNNQQPTTSGISVNQIVNVADVDVPSTSHNVNYTIIEMPPGSFDIILLIDKNETGGLKKKNDPTVAQFNKYPDLNHQYRSLKVGDFTWVARHKVNHNQELVLPFVVERKRMDDLGASIKDGRFHEQKFRLRKCGLKNVIYMVENYGKNKNVGLPIQNLMQALANTRVQDGFKVHITDSLTNSARFLAMMTRRLIIRYKDKHLRGRNDDPQGEDLMTFEYFNKSSAKTKALTVSETFIKLLLQLKGVSVEKALAITKKYPTPRSLMTAYVKCDRKEGELLLAHLKYSDLNRNVGPLTSKAIYQLFSSCSDE